VTRSEGRHCQNPVQSNLQRSTTVVCIRAAGLSIVNSKVVLQLFLSLLTITFSIKMSMYPSLEDMKTTELIMAQMEAFTPVSIQHGGAHVQHAYPTLDNPPAYGSGEPTAPGHGNLSLAYPSLHEFMGLELTEAVIRANMPEYLDKYTVASCQPTSVVPARQTNSGVAVIAPISGSNAVVKSLVTHGVRRCNIVKGNEKVGLRVRAMNTGVFVCLVMDDSPAARAGLRFGDQILQIDGIDMAGMSVEKVHAIFKKKNTGELTSLAIRDRPFERTVTLVRDSANHIGFQFKDGKIINIVKDSSAARNGLLTDHALLEVNGKNVIGLKDKEITKIISNMEGNALTVTVMPSFLFNHMVKEMDTSLFGKMDHSNPDF